MNDVLKEKLRDELSKLLGELPISPDYVLEVIWKVIVDHFKELYK